MLKMVSINILNTNICTETRQNVDNDDVNAVTWGVFKGKEVI